MDQPGQIAVPKAITLEEGAGAFCAVRPNLACFYLASALIRRPALAAIFAFGRFASTAIFGFRRPASRASFVFRRLASTTVFALRRVASTAIFAFLRAVPRATNFVRCVPTWW